jgi:hypothetical protein
MLTIQDIRKALENIKDHIHKTLSSTPTHSARWWHEIISRLKISKKQVHSK